MRPTLRRSLVRRSFVYPVLTALLYLAPDAALAAGGGGGGNMGGGSPGGFGGRSGADLTETFEEGVQQLADGECKLAEKSFRKVLRAVSKNPEANYLRGLALQCQGEHKAAARYLKKARRYDRKFYAAYEKLGVSYLALDDREDAEEQLEDLAEMIEDCDGDCSSKLMRAHADLKAAIEGVDAESAASPETAPGEPHSLLKTPADHARSQAAYLDAVQLINARDFPAAIASLRRLAETTGPHPDVLNYLGYAHRQLGLFEAAQAYYEQALAIDPMHRGANEYLGEMWIELGRMNEARERLSVLDRICPFGCAEFEDLKRRIEARAATAD